MVKHLLVSFHNKVSNYILWLKICIGRFIDIIKMKDQVVYHVKIWNNLRTMQGQKEGKEI